ncbi:hypothetical protein [Alteromonas flava]|uniref:hypothetical protein n=1 Tax=Alteromonas flava TaxID=2048003 RepID=UPI0013DCE8AA|nr:hypothetical protein [Alteromonas flava]
MKNNREQTQPASVFSRLHVRQAHKVKATPKKARTLMALSADDHKAMAQLIQKWLGES